MMNDIKIQDNSNGENDGEKMAMEISSRKEAGEGEASSDSVYQDVCDNSKTHELKKQSEDKKLGQVNIFCSYHTQTNFN